jgi:probable rRNA maturation factor
VPVDVDLTEGLAWPIDPIAADAERALAHLGLDEAELSIVLCDDATIRVLNHDWRGQDRPTDVLSFSQQDGVQVPGGSGLLGDIVISVDTAGRQAADRGIDVHAEVRVLLVHGLCHLLGHDHERDDEAAVMERLEREILAALREAAKR